MKLFVMNITRRDCSTNAARGMYWAVRDGAEFFDCGCPKEPIGGFEIEAFEELTGLRLVAGEQVRVALSAWSPPPEKGSGESN